MLIFDRFPSLDNAQRFAASVNKTFGREALVFTSQEESDKHDMFPFTLEAPIVLVSRDDDSGKEARIVSSVKPFNGSFAGT